MYLAPGRAAAAEIRKSFVERVKSAEVG